MTTSNKIIHQDEMANLIIGLHERHIQFRLQSIYDGLSLVCDGWDAICHQYSYGGTDGLIEVMGLPQCDGDVIGYLTANEILKMVDELKDKE